VLKSVVVSITVLVKNVPISIHCGVDKRQIGRHILPLQKTGSEVSEHAQ